MKYESDKGICTRTRSQSKGSGIKKIFESVRQQYILIIIISAISYPPLFIHNVKLVAYRPTHSPTVP